MIFGADMSSSVDIDNKKKDSKILGACPTQGLNDTTFTTLTAEKEYSINFSGQQNLPYNVVNSYFIVNGVEIYKFKARDSETNASPLYLGNVSKDFSVDNMKNTGLYGYVYGFSIDYDSIDVDDILDVHKYLMVKNI